MRAFYDKYHIAFAVTIWVVLFVEYPVPVAILAAITILHDITKLNRGDTK